MRTRGQLTDSELFETDEIAVEVKWGAETVTLKDENVSISFPDGSQIELKGDLRVSLNEEDDGKIELV